MSASTKSTVDSPATADGGASDIMAAIQRVLAEHNVSDARFVLELPGASPLQSDGSAARPYVTSASPAGDKREKRSSGVPEADAASPTALLMQLQAAPAAAPPSLPVHHGPPPRARSVSTEPAVANTTPLRGAAPEKPSLSTPAAQKRDLPVEAARLPDAPSPAQPPATEASARAEASIGGTEAVGTPPRQNSLLSLPESSSFSSLASHASPCGTAQPAAAFSSDMAELRRLSELVVREVAAAGGGATTKDALRSFVGRSAILEDRRRRDSAAQSGSQWSPSAGLPLFPSPPSSSFSPPRTTASTAVAGATPKKPVTSAASTTADGVVSAPPSVRAGPQPLQSSLMSSGSGFTATSTANNGSISRASAPSGVVGGSSSGGGGGTQTGTTAISTTHSNTIGAGAADSHTPSRQPIPQRRSVVLVSSPDRGTANAVAAGGASFGVAAPRGGGGGASNGSGSRVVPPAGSLPSLVAARKSAVPGRTPVFSILNKEGSRLLDINTSAGGNAAGASAGAGGGTGPTSTTNNNTSNTIKSTNSACSSSSVGDGSPRCHPAAAAAASTKSGSNRSSLFASQHSRPSSVLLMSDDRAPPSPVYSPLIGSEAEEQAIRKPSILVQSSQNPPSRLTAATSATTTAVTVAVDTSVAAPQPVEAAASTGTADANAPSATTTTAATAEPTPVEAPPSPGLWTEQSRENTRRALQLQSQSRLSHTTETLQTNDGLRTRGPSHSARRASATTAGTAVAVATGVSPNTVPVSASRNPSPSLPSPQPPTTAASSPGARPSLREMLREQQQLHDASRRGLEEHARRMQEANVVRPSPTPAALSSSSSSSFTAAAAGAANSAATITTRSTAAATSSAVPASSVYTIRPSSTLSASASITAASAAAASADTTPKAPATVTANVRRTLSMSGNSSSGSHGTTPLTTAIHHSNHNNSSSTSSNSGCRTHTLPTPRSPKKMESVSKTSPPTALPFTATVAAPAVAAAAAAAPAAARAHSLGKATSIQVIKFTLPPDGEARQSAVQQLRRSPSGAQHVDSTGRYEASLNVQQEKSTIASESESGGLNRANKK